MDASRRRAVNFYKTLIVTALVIILIFPWVVSITVLNKIGKLEAQLESILANCEPPANAVAKLQQLSPFPDSLTAVEAAQLQSSPLTPSLRRCCRSAAPREEP
jgi:hypothetical protein